MGVVFGGYDAVDPIVLRSYCYEQDPPLPIASFWGKVNAIRIGHGMEAGQGWLLMRRGDADELVSDDQYDLTFYGVNKSATLKNLCFVKYTVVSPGVRGDENAHVLVEIRDRRWRYQQYTIDFAYNVRSGSGTSDYYSETKNSGSPWTWNQMVQDIWNNIDGLDGYPGLPFTPDGTPEGWFFYGENAWDALTCVLNRLSCTLKLDPFTDVITIVRIGVANSQITTALEKYDEQRMWDDEPDEATKGRVAEWVRVIFRKYPQPNQQNVSPYHTIDQLTGVSGESGTTYNLYDDLYARYDNNGSLLNLADLTSRATERNTDYVRAYQQGMMRMHRVFIDALDDTGLRPDGTVKAIAMEERGLGTKTEIVRYPFVLPQCRLPNFGELPSIFVRRTFHEERFEETINRLAFFCPSGSTVPTPGSGSAAGPMPCCPDGTGPQQSDTLVATLSSVDCPCLDAGTFNLTWDGPALGFLGGYAPPGCGCDAFCSMLVKFWCDTNTGLWTLTNVLCASNDSVFGCSSYNVPADSADCNANTFLFNSIDAALSTCCCCAAGTQVTITITVL